jgi:Cu2+-exporting ATPase
MAVAVRAIESSSTHPLAEAVVRHLSAVAGHCRVASVQELPGKGLAADADGEAWLVGNRRLLEEHGIAITGDWRQHEKRWQEAASTVVWVAAAGQVRAAMAVADRIRPEAAAAIGRLQHDGIKVYMQTGDARRTAAAVAKAVGIAEHRSEVLPKDKAAFVAGLRAMGETVAMVGDGINDSEALAAADTGIAMGGGADIAMEVADVSLMHGDLAALPRAIVLSKRTAAAIRQNLFWAFAYNVLGIPIAAGALIPVNGFHLDPMLASAAMALSSVSVVGNSLRLRRAPL